VTGANFIGPKYRLKTYLPEVSDLAMGAGARGWGRSGKCGVHPADAADAGARSGKEQKHRSNDAHRPKVPKRHPNDSTASLVTEGLLGKSSGEHNARLHRRATERGARNYRCRGEAIKQVVERSADVLANLQALSDSAKDLLTGVQEGQGHWGSCSRRSGVQEPECVLAKTNQVVSDIQGGKARWASWWSRMNCMAK